MTRKKISKKTTEDSENLDPTQDEFVEKSMTALDWAVERRKPIGVLLAIILAAWVGLIIVNHQSEKKLESESKLLGDAIAISMSPVEGQVAAAALDDGESAFASDAERRAAAVQKYDEAIKKSSDANLKALAKLAKASELAEDAKYDEAVALLKDAMKTQLPEPVMVNARVALADALLASGKTDEAAVAFKKIAEGAKGRQALWGKLGQANAAADAKAAESMFQEIISSIEKEGIESGDYLFAQARAGLLNINPDAKVPDVPSGINMQMLQQMLMQQQAQQAAGGMAQ